MQEFERIQTSGCVPRPSKMDLATQGEDMNPMALSFQDSSCNSGGSSRAAIPAAPETCELLSASPPASSLQPVFSQAAPGEQFGSRLPDSVPQTQAPPHKRFTATSSETSSRTSTPPISLFFGRFSTGTSAMSASRASSVCSSTVRHTYSQVVQ
jgi:hypothetical protein